MLFEQAKKLCLMTKEEIMAKQYFCLTYVK